jgi:hypothetical protein
MNALRSSLLAALALAASACEPPPVFAGADRRQNARPARVEGQLVVSSTARGNVVVLLYDAARPPPPTGTGRPLSFALVPRERVFGAVRDFDPGPFTAPFAFSLVNPGQYQLRAFIDGNDDFVPWYGVTNEVNAGDVGGAAIDAITRLPLTFEVAQGPDGAPVPATDVPVTISDSARVTVDRPVFEVTMPGSTAPLTTEVTLAAAPLALELRTRAVNEGVVQQVNPVFLARLVDDNADGMPDDANGDGVPDMWPRVVVRKLANEAAGVNPLADENDLDRNGLVDETGVDYDHVNPMNPTGPPLPADGAPDVVVLAAGFNVMELAPQLLDAMGRVKPTPTPLTRLPLVIRPLALDATDPRRPQPIRGVPEGRYAITVLQQTGQTWRVPNELQDGLATRFGLPVVSSQTFIVRVGPKP